MKRFIAIMIALCILILPGCNSQQQSDNPTEVTSTTPSTEVTSTTSSTEVTSTTPSTENSVETTMPPETTEPNSFAKYGISDELIDAYWEKFAKYYSIEEYTALCDICNQISAIPEVAVNANLFLAVRDLSTYNKVDKNAILLNKSGEIVREYEDIEESEYLTYIPSTYSIGNYSIVSSDVSLMQDVFNNEGDFVGTYYITEGIVEIIFDIGDEYYVFVPKNSRTHCLQLICPTGEVFYVDTDYYNDPSYEDLLNGNVAVGNMSEGMFSIHYEYINDTYAYYFNVDGEVAIDLSEDIVNFEVLELGEFIDGQATIRFKGADYKTYTGVIDTHGEFITSPEAE